MSEPNTPQSPLNWDPDMRRALEAGPTLNEGMAVLALRAYPSLKKSGVCSAHRENHQFSCTTCYPDPNALLAAHIKVSDELYQNLLELAGLSDPLNGRIGTNKILAEIRRKLEGVAKP